MTARQESKASSCQLGVPVGAGQRLNQCFLSFAPWRHIDLNEQTAYFPKTKTDVPRTIPLSKNAVAALKNFGEKKEGRVFSVWGESNR